MRGVHLVIGNSLKSASSIYSYLARISLWCVFDSVTQLVEYHTFNVRVMGSNPIGVTSILMREQGERPRLPQII